jgi:hypothetical protein
MVFKACTALSMKHTVSDQLINVLFATLEAPLAYIFMHRDTRVLENNYFVRCWRLIALICDSGKEIKLHLPECLLTDLYPLLLEEVISVDA